MPNDENHIKLYTLHTSANYELVSEVTTMLACKSGEPAFLEEQPNGFAVIGPPRPIVWTRGRWIVTLAALSLAPFVFRSIPGINGLAGYGLGWMAASFVLLGRRR